MAFIDEFEDLLSATLVVKPIASRDAFGLPAISSPSVPVGCRITPTGGSMIKDSNGNEVLARYSVICGTKISLDVEGFRYDLPDTYPEPNVDLEALRVNIVSDEDGSVAYQKVIFE